MEWDYHYVIAVDYDGTLCNESKEINEDVLTFTKQAKRLGCIIVLWTSRCNTELQEAIDTCASRGLYFDYINEYPLRTESPKVCADMYIDNKSTTNGKIPIKKFWKKLMKDLETGNYNLVERP